MQDVKLEENRIVESDFYLLTIILYEFLIPFIICNLKITKI